MVLAECAHVQGGSHVLSARVRHAHISKEQEKKEALDAKELEMLHALGEENNALAV